MLIRFTDPLYVLCPSPHAKARKPMTDTQSTRRLSWGSMERAAVSVRCYQSSSVRVWAGHESRLHGVMHPLLWCTDRALSWSTDTPLCPFDCSCCF